MIQEEKPNKKVIDANQLLKQLNLGQQPATIDTGAPQQPKTDPWGTDLQTLDLDEMLGVKPAMPTPGFIEGINMKLTSGAMTTAEGITEVPQFGEAIKQAGVSALANAFINRQVKKGKLTQKQGEEEKARTQGYLPKIDFLGIPHPAETVLPGTKMAEGNVNKWLHDQAATINEANNRYDKSMTDYIKTGDYGKALGATIYNIAESLPATLVAAYAGPAGAATLGMTTGAQTYDEVKDRECNEWN